MDELIKRLNVFRLKEGEYQYIPVYVSEIIGEAADAICSLENVVKALGGGRIALTIIPAEEGE